MMIERGTGCWVVLELNSLACCAVPGIPGCDGWEG